MKLRFYLILVLFCLLPDLSKSDAPIWIKCGSDHFDDAINFSVSPDNKYFTFYSTGKTHFVDIESTNLKKLVEYYPFAPPYFLENNKKMLVLNNNFNVAILDMESSEIVDTFDLKKDGKSFISMGAIGTFSEKYNILAMLGRWDENSADNTSLTLWDLKNGSFLDELNLNTTLLDICINNNTGDIFINSYFEVIVYNIEQKKIRKKESIEDYEKLCISDDGKYLAGLVSSNEFDNIYGYKHFCEIRNSENLSLINRFESSHFAKKFAFTPDSKNIAFVNNTRSKVEWEEYKNIITEVEVRNIGTGDLVKKIPSKLLYPDYINFTSDGNNIIISEDITGFSQMIEYNNIDNRKFLVSNDINAETIQFSKDGKYFAGYYRLYGSRTNVINTETGELINRFKVPLQFADGECLSVKFSNDNNYLAYSGVSRIFIFLDYINDDTLHYEEPDIVKDIAFSYDNQIFATGNYDCKIRVYDYKTKKIIKTLENYDKSFLKITFSSDNKRIFGVAVDKNNRYNVEIIEWNLENDEINKFNSSLIEGLFKQSIIEVSNNGRYFITGEFLFDTEKKKLIQLPFVPGISSVSVSDDGNYIALGMYHQGDLATYFSLYNNVIKEKIGDYELMDYVSYINNTDYHISQFGVAITPDCKKIITCTEDCHLALWDLNITGVKNLDIVENNDISVYPNPNNNNDFNILIKSDISELTNIVLCDLSGIIVKNIYNGYLNTGIVSFNINNLSAGSYYLILQSSTSRKVKKIIVM
jgi:WD40 repeat protein